MTYPENYFGVIDRKFKQLGIQNTVYFTNDKYKNLKQSAFETGHFLDFQLFACGFFLAGFSALYCTSMSPDAQYWFIFDAQYQYDRFIHKKSQE